MSFKIFSQWNGIGANKDERFKAAQYLAELKVTSKYYYSDIIISQCSCSPNVENVPLRC